MPDIRCNGGNEWPRSYTSGELEAIAQSNSHGEPPPHIVERLQDAVGAYQRGHSFDDGEVFPGFKVETLTNKGRRKKLKRIIELCEEDAAAYEIQEVVDELDGPTSQLLVFDPEKKRAPNATDRQGMLDVAVRVLNQIPLSGPEPARARLGFIRDLIPIFEDLTGLPAGRRRNDVEYGPFLNFVRAALDPFHATQGCEDDMKDALQLHKAAQEDRAAEHQDSRSGAIGHIRP